MAAGRKHRISTYIDKPTRQVKNIGTKRTTSATIHRDLSKLASAKSNKRVK